MSDGKRETSVRRSYGDDCFLDLKVASRILRDGTVLYAAS